MYADRRFLHNSFNDYGGLNSAYSGLTFYRTREREHNQRASNSSGSGGGGGGGGGLGGSRSGLFDYPLTTLINRSTRTPSSTVNSNNSTTGNNVTGDLVPLSVYRYRDTTGDTRAASHTLTNRSNGRSSNCRQHLTCQQVCRCPQVSTSVNNSTGLAPINCLSNNNGNTLTSTLQQTCSPPAVFGHSSNVNSTSFRTVQSLPSSPNANRRPLTPPSLLNVSGNQSSLAPSQPTAAVVSSSLAITAGSNARQSDHRPFIDSTRPEQQFLFTNDGNINANTTGSQSVNRPVDPLLTDTFRGQLNMRFRSASSQPLAKFTSFIIIVLAIIIIGFIVLSPVFHYAM